jgi:hypothetical protein
MKKLRGLLTGMAGCALLIIVGGCSGTSMTWPITQPSPAMTADGKPIPRVQDCLSIKQATPSQFVCNGKVYTANELRKLREDAAKAGSASS